ncbi:hypothetical protein [Pseudomonas abieticivorans]|uniref:hypothetical protein n=1 Tax=Pseudomonas abieticivorans TaxID=2931382 RepID=UPI0020BDEEFB|nr:hypothetical protein [Pseudomonas sp. PIA16]
MTLAVKMGRFARFHKLTVMNRDAREMMSALTPTGLDSISLEIAKESDIQESIHSYIGLSQSHFVGAFFEWIAHSAKACMFNYTH